MSSARFLRALRSAFVKLAFWFFGKTATRKTGNLSLRQMYNYTRPAALAHVLPRPANLAKSARTRHDIAALGVRCNHCHNVRTLLLAEELSSSREVRRCFDNGLHSSLLYSNGHLPSSGIVYHWTPTS